MTAAETAEREAVSDAGLTMGQASGFIRDRFRMRKPAPDSLRSKPTYDHENDCWMTRRPTS